MSQRTEQFQSLRTQQLRLQNSDNTYPALGAVMAVGDVRGTIAPTLNPVVTSVGLKTGASVGRLTFDGTQLLVNGIPIGGGSGGGGGAIVAEQGQFLYFNNSRASGTSILTSNGNTLQPRAHIIPDVSGAYDIGSEAIPFRTVHASSGLNIGKLHLTASGDYIHVRSATRDYVLTPMTRSAVSSGRSPVARTFSAPVQTTFSGSRRDKIAQIVLPGCGTYMILYRAEVEFQRVDSDRTSCFVITPDDNVLKQQRYSDIREGHTYTYSFMFTVSNKSKTQVHFAYPNGTFTLSGSYEFIRF